MKLVGFFIKDCDNNGIKIVKCFNLIIIKIIIGEIK